MRHSDSRVHWMEERVGGSDDACLFTPFSAATNGYVKVGRRTANNVMCELAHGPRPSPSHESAHSCGNRACVNPKHLSWKTRSGNEHDKIAHGTSNRGSRNGNAKLTEADVREIRGRPGDAVGDLASEFGVTRAVISRVRSGEAWRNV